MQRDHEHYHRPENKIKWWQTNTGMLLIIFFAIGGYFLVNEHSAHIADNAFLLFLLLCPLIHIFMHGGHGGHGHHDDDDNHNDDRGG